MATHTFRVSDPVAFMSKRGEEQGFIAHMQGKTAVVVVTDGKEFRVPVTLLKLRVGTEPQRVRTRNDDARALFKEGDRVSFTARESRHFGRISKLNPKYARVECDGLTWQVAYVSLKLEDAAGDRSNHRLRLAEIELEADALLKRHGLASWRFGFDQAARRGGKCAYRKKEITLSEQFVLAAQAEEVTDTILHEIAHALVGGKHGHDTVWQAKAREIGCSARVTHDVDFSAARWLMTCRKCGWQLPRHRRRRGLVCATCGEAAVYLPNDEDSTNSVSV